MKNLFLSILAVFTLLGCQTQTSYNYQVTESEAAELAEYFEGSQLPAAIMGHIKKDGSTHWEAFGPSVWGGEDTVSADHIFRIYSMTKAISSVAAMQLVEQGKITLDEPLNELMPEMAAIPILTDEGELVESSAPITLRQLLTHTAGFGYDFTSEKLKNFDTEGWTYPDYPRIFEPGTEWRYGTNTAWVGRVIEKVSGEDLETYFRNNVTGPLGMNSTWFNVPEELQENIVSWGLRYPNGFNELPRLPVEVVTQYNAGGGLYGSPSDYVKFLHCMLNYGAYDGGDLLSRETVEMMLENHLPTGVSLTFEPVVSDMVSPTGSFNDPADEWGLGWAIEANPDESVRPKGAVYWAGAANSFFTLDVSNEVAVVYFTNYFPFNDKTTVDFYHLYEQKVYTDETE